MKLIKFFLNFEILFFFKLKNITSTEVFTLRVCLCMCVDENKCEKFNTKKASFFLINLFVIF
jgi:hypothetical protein